MRLLVPALVVLAVAAPAGAAVAPRFDRDVARRGDAVSVFQPGGLPWLRADRRSMPVYLVPAATVGAVIGSGGSPRVGPPRGGRVLRVATWTTRRPRARFRLTVPPGRYAAVVWCLPCGGTLVASVPWSVPPGVELRPDGSLLTVRG